VNKKSRVGQGEILTGFGVDGTLGFVVRTPTYRALTRIPVEGLIQAYSWASQHRWELEVMTMNARIEVNPKVMLGKPVIRGTRITVELILRKLGEGATQADLLDAYPGLTLEDIQAAMIYAADTLAHEETILLGASS
jgi:uncharacterized protein (DUF433 family)